VYCSRMQCYSCGILRETCWWLASPDGQWRARLEIRRTLETFDSSAIDAATLGALVAGGYADIAVSAVLPLELYCLSEWRCGKHQDQRHTDCTDDRADYRHCSTAGAAHRPQPRFAPECCRRSSMRRCGRPMEHSPANTAGRVQAIHLLPRVRGGIVTLHGVMHSSTCMLNVWQCGRYTGRASGSCSACSPPPKGSSLYQRLIILGRGAMAYGKFSVAKDCFEAAGAAWS
jgi:hypothetical protein